MQPLKNFLLFRKIHTTKAALEHVVNLVKYISKVDMNRRELLFSSSSPQPSLFTNLYHLPVKIWANEASLRQPLAKYWHLLYGQMWPGLWRKANSVLQS